MDWCHYSGIAVILIQLGVAAIPFALYRDYSALLVTGAGTILTILMAALLQWHTEKFSGQHGCKKVITITSGNGALNVLVVVNPGVKGSIDLEDLTSGQSPLSHYNRPEGVSLAFGAPRPLCITQVACVALAILWVMFLLTIMQLVMNTWYLLFVGSLGMIHNVIVAGAPRSPSTGMIHVEKVEEIWRNKVMDALMGAECAYPKLGRVLLLEFFGEHLRPDKTCWWDGDRDAYDNVRKEEKRGGTLIDNDKDLAPGVEKV